MANPREKTIEELTSDWQDAAERAREARNRAETLDREYNQARANYSNLRNAEAKAFEALQEWRRSTGLEPPAPKSVGRIASPPAE
jgi:hypothetical protein